MAYSQLSGNTSRIQLVFFFLNNICLNIFFEAKMSGVICTMFQISKAEVVGDQTFENHNFFL